jgi:hypothetical protein
MEKVFIEEQRDGYTRYRKLPSGYHPEGQRWEVLGHCNQCGLCEIGDNSGRIKWIGPPGTPYSAVDTTFGKRPDNPLLPKFIENMKQMAKETKTATVEGCSFEIKVLGTLKDAD